MPDDSYDSEGASLLKLGLGFWASKALLSAVELQVFTVLAREPMNARRLAAAVGIHERGARDFFDALTALGVLDRQQGNYRNAPAASRFLDKGKTSYIGGLLEMCNTRLYGFWGDLTEGLRTGAPQNEDKLGGDGGARYADPAKLEEFLRAMSGLSGEAGKALARKFPWRDFGSFADIGCAQGAVPVQIALSHPRICGVGFDLPPVEPIFLDYIASMGVDDRLSFVAGDFFVDEMPTADVLIMGHILQRWSLAQKRLLIEKAYRAVPESGALIVYDWIIDDGRRENAFGLLMSLNMLIESPDGFDYTGADCEGWMTEAGFRKTKRQHLTGFESMMVGFK